MLKSEQAETVQAAAQLLGRHHVTAQEWLRRYREGGLERMLQTPARSGRPRAIPQWAEAALQKRLEASAGFDGYQAICDWLETQLGLEVKYKTVHKLVHKRLQAAPKVPCPLSVQQSSE